MPNLSYRDKIKEKNFEERLLKSQSMLPEFQEIEDEEDIEIDELDYED